MAGGRPSKFKPEFVLQARRLCALGATDAQLAEFFEISLDTLYAWKKTRTEFSDALKEAKEDFDSQVERSLCQRAIGYTHDAVKIFNSDGKPLIVPYTERYPPDPTSMIFWLKNRQPQRWRDKQDLEHSGNITVEIVKFSGAS